jgi:hypothetical protein
VRSAHRIPREGIALLLLQTRTYDIKNLVDQVAWLLGTLSVPELKIVGNRFQAIVEKARAREFARTAPAAARGKRTA